MPPRPSMPRQTLIPCFSAPESACTCHGSSKGRSHLRANSLTHVLVDRDKWQRRSEEDEMSRDDEGFEEGGRESDVTPFLTAGSPSAENLGIHAAGTTETLKSGWGGQGSLAATRGKSLKCMICVPKVTDSTMKKRLQTKTTTVTTEHCLHRLRLPIT